jgi:hypothetical protein
MGSKQKQVLALVLGGVLGMATGAWAGARVITTAAGCQSTFQHNSLYSACMNCVKAHHKFKLDTNNAWGCK